MPPEIPQAQPAPSTLPIPPPVPPPPIARKIPKRIDTIEYDLGILAVTLIIFFILLLLGITLMSNTSNEFLYWLIGLIMIVAAVILLIVSVINLVYKPPVKIPKAQSIHMPYPPPPPGIKKESARMDLVGIGIGLLAMGVILISFGGYLYSFWDLYEPGSTPDEIILHRPFGIWAILLIVFGFIILFLGLATLASIYPEKEEWYDARSHLSPEEEMMKVNMKMLYESIATLVIGSVFLASAFYVIGDSFGEFLDGSSVSGYSPDDPYMLVGLILLIVGIIIVLVGIIYLIWSIYRLWRQKKHDVKQAQKQR